MLPAKMTGSWKGVLPTLKQAFSRSAPSNGWHSFDEIRAIFFSSSSVLLSSREQAVPLGIIAALRFRHVVSMGC